MRQVSIVIFMLATACTHSTSPVVASAKAPSLVTPPVTPVVTPPVVPITYTWPTAEAVQTSTYGSYSCSVTNVLNLECFDGTSAPFTQPAPYVHENALVVVGNGVSCSLLDSQGAPSSCANVTDPSCTNGPNSAAVVCFTPTDTNPVLMHVDDQNGCGDTSTYNSGPLALTVDGSGNVCIEESVFLISDGSLVGNFTNCGTTIATGGYIE